jgi:hypothetical protein
MGSELTVLDRFVMKAMRNGGYADDMDSHEFVGRCELVVQVNDCLVFKFIYMDYDIEKDAGVIVRWLPEEQKWIGEYV